MLCLSAMKCFIPVKNLLVCELISKFLSKLRKTKKIEFISKIVKLIAFVVLMFQIIELTVSYLKYETVIDMKAIPKGEQRPTFTFCLKNKGEFSRKKSYSVAFDNRIGCAQNQKHTKSNKIPHINCSKLSRIVESVTPLSPKCLSYYSRLFDENYSPNNSFLFVFFIHITINAFALIHQSATPPHFTKDMIEIEKSQLNEITYSSIERNLLPFPYETDCYDYEREEKSLIRYKSREDCIVKHLERRELFECGCNKRWLYRDLRFGNFSNICPKTVRCHLNLKIEIKLLEKICKKNCVNHHFFNIITSAKYLSKDKKFKISYFVPFKTNKNEIIFNHLPKMNLVEYFCSIGGLISMWFGISVYDLLLIFVRETKKRISYPLTIIGFKIKNSMHFKFKGLTQHNYNKIFSKIIILLLSALVFYQSITIFLKYLDYEIVTRFEVQEIKSIPTILIEKYSPKTLRMAKELIKIYPELKRFSPSSLAKSNDLEKFKRKLLSENKWNDFQRIVGSEKIIETCYLMIDNKENNFSRFESGITNSALGLSFFNYLNFSSIDKNKIDRIAISLFNSDEYSIHLEPFNINEYFFELNNDFRYKLTFWSFLTLKLSLYDQKCISEESVKDFSDEYFEFCKQDTYLEIANETYGCFPSKGIYAYIERDIKRNGHKFCNDSYVADSNFETKVDKISKTKCKPKCNFTNFEFKLEVSKHISNKMFVEFIPKKSPRIAYIETFKIDLDRLIYNCGGVFGLWFGLTPAKLVDLMQYSFQIFGISRNKIKKMSQLLLTIFKRCIHRIITITYRFIRNLFSNFLVLSHNLIKLCIRCVQNSFTRLICFVYQLIVTFIKCFICLKVIFFKFIHSLFANMLAFSRTSIKLFIRCVQNSLTHLISFVYQSIVNLKKCFIWLKVIFFKLIDSLFANLTVFYHNLKVLCIR